MTCRCDSSIECSLQATVQPWLKCKIATRTSALVSRMSLQCFAFGTAMAKETFQGFNISQLPPQGKVESVL